jgi:hypothetical protein
MPKTSLKAKGNLSVAAEENVREDTGTNARAASKGSTDGVTVHEELASAL